MSHSSSPRLPTPVGTSSRIAAVQKLTDSEVGKVIEAQLQKSPRRSKAEAEAEADVDAEEGDVEEAA